MRELQREIERLRAEISDLKDGPSAQKHQVTQENKLEK
jgi:serine O-acetyltransferase